MLGKYAKNGNLIYLFTYQFVHLPYKRQHNLSNFILIFKFEKIYAIFIHLNGLIYYLVIQVKPLPVFIRLEQSSLHHS